MKELKQHFYQALYSWSRQRLDRLVVAEEGTHSDWRPNNPANGFKITTHALLCYFERVEHFDLEEIKRRLTSENLAKRVAKLGDGKYPVENFRVTVIGHTIITVDDGRSYHAANKPKEKQIHG